MAVIVALGDYSWRMTLEATAATAGVGSRETGTARFLQEQASGGDGFEPAPLTGVDFNAFLAPGTRSSVGWVGQGDGCCLRATSCAALGRT